MSRKIVTVVGARPQFIKAAAVSRSIRKAGFVERIVHTGQHFDQNMSEIFFKEMGIPMPDYNLGISSLGHGAMTGRMLEGIEQVLMTEKPDFLLVYGDTNSTIAGALAARKMGIKVAHVEAGLRSFNMSMPEEINRILTDRISDFLFCPTDTAIQNLTNEGFNGFDCQVVKSGDVMYDAALYYSKVSKTKSTIVSDLELASKGFILATVHRQENTDNHERLHEIINGLNDLNRKIPVLLPLHPRTRKILESLNIKCDFMRIDPVGYFDMIELIKHSALVMTDSGGLQKEAFFFKKFCVTMRDETEWVELVDHGYNILAGANGTQIVNCVTSMLSKQSQFDIELYGSGNASDVITAKLMGY